MSFDFRTVREPSGDPVLKYISHLSKALSKSITKGLIDQLESSEDIFGDIQDTESAIKFQTNLNSSHTFNFDKDYYPPVDPGTICNLWLRGYNMGFNLRDFSEYGHVAYIGDGEPILIDGDPFDYGMFDESMGVKSIALRFNRPTSPAVNSEYIHVPDNSGLRVSGISTGISYFMRIRLHSLALQGGSTLRLFEKTDDTTPSNGVMARVETDGRLQFQIARAGTVYNKETAAGTVTTDTVYDIWFTYANSGNTIKIYVNNVDKSLSDIADINWHNGSNNTVHDLRIMKRGPQTDAGHVYGDFYDFKIYRETVVSTAQVGYHWTNKLSISNIPFGQVIVANHWAPKQVAGAGYTTTGYTTTGYTT